MNKTNCLLKTAELLAKLAVSNNQKNIQCMKMSEWHYLFTVTKDLKDELLTTLEQYHWTKIC